MKTTFSRFLAVTLAVAMVLTCAISSFVLPVTAGDTQSTSENLLADFVLPQTEFAAGEKTSSMDTGVALEPGRYVYRFEAIGTRAFVSLWAGSWIQTNTNSGLENWRMHQQYFELTEAVEACDLQLGNLSSTEGDSCQIRNVQLYKVGDFFNLIPGADMSIESTIWEHNTNGLSPTYTAGAVHVKDPTNTQNTVLQLARGKTHYMYFPNAFDANGGYTIPEDRVLMVSLRRSGGGILYRRSYHGNYASYSYDSTRATALNEWTTDILYITQADLTNTGGLYLNLNTNTNYAQAGPYTDAVTYIDDIVICEVPASTAIQMSESAVSMFAGATTKLTVVGKPDKSYPGTVTWSSDNEAVATVSNGTVTAAAGAVAGSTATITATAGSLSATCVVTIKQPTVNEDIYFENNIVKVPAIQNSTYDVSAQLKTALVGYEPTLSMTVANGSCTTWNNTAGDWSGAEKTIVSVVSGTTLKIVNDGMSTKNGSYALNRVSPTITVTDAYGNTATAAVEWEWPKRVVNVDFETGSHKLINKYGDGDEKNGEIVTDTDGNNILKLPAGATGGYINAFYIAYKPNTTYRISFRSKSSDTTGTNQFAITYSGVGITRVGSSWPMTVTKTTEWTTSVGYFTTDAAPAVAGNYMVNFSTQASSSTNDVYLDDFFVEEVDTNQPEFYFENNVIKVPAIADSTYDLSSQLKTTLDGYKPALTWSISNNGTTLYGANKDWNGAAKTDKVTLSGSMLKIANATGSGSSEVWSLARVSPIITATDAFGNTTTAKVEWDWPETAVHIDFDNVLPSNTTMQGAVTTEEGTTNKVMAVDTTAGWSNIWFKANYHLKPNSKYRISMRTKVADGDTTSQVRLIYNTLVDFKVSSGYGTQNGILSVTDGSGEWNLTTATVYTGEAPAILNNYNHYFAIMGKSGTILVDDIRVDLIAEDAPLNANDGFELHDITTSQFEKTYGNTVYEHVAAGSLDGGIGGNTTGMIKMNPGIEGGNSTSSFYINVIEMKAHHAYKISFKHYGDKGSFTAITYAPTIIEAGGGTQPLAATDTWTEYEVYFVTGYSFTSQGNWPYLFYFDSHDSTDAFYIDDFEITEIQTVYTMRGDNHVDHEEESNNVANPTLADYDQKNALYGTLNLSKGSNSLYTKNNVRPIEVGTEMTVTVTPNEGYLPIPGTLELVTLSGERTPILNSALTAMTESKGNEFTFVTPDETAYVTCEFAAIASDAETEYIGQGYQWGTIGSALRRTEGVIDGMRFLNRLYIDGLDWDTDALKTTIDGKEYTIMEIGAKARVYDANATTSLYEDEKALAGVCYEDGNPNVKVTDYTLKYFDFTVVIPIAEDADHNVQYECGSYMVLRDAEGNTETVYTTAMVDSVAAAVGRGA